MTHSLLSNKKDILNWLDKFGIKNYDIIPDKKYGFVVDVYGDVFLCNENLLFIAVKFNIVTGNFFCFENNLESLYGCPKHVDKNFNCSDNKLKSLEFSPTVGRNFLCSNNQISSLEGAPEEIFGNFNAHGNKLTSLQGCPQKIGQGFHCSHNQIFSLEYIPEEVGGSIYINDNYELQQYQEIKNFNELYEAHRQIMVLKNKNMLDQKIQDYFPSYDKDHKFKI